MITSTRETNQRDKEMRYSPSINIKTVPAYDMSKDGNGQKRTFNISEAKNMIAEGWYCKRVNVCANVAKVKYGYTA